QARSQSGNQSHTPLPPFFLKPIREMWKVFSINAAPVTLSETDEIAFTCLPIREMEPSVSRFGRIFSNRDRLRQKRKLCPLQHRCQRGRRWGRPGRIASSRGLHFL